MVYYGYCEKHKRRMVAGHNFEGVCPQCQTEERQRPISRRDKGETKMSAKNVLYTIEERNKILSVLIKRGHVEPNFDFYKYHPSDTCVTTDDNIKCPECKNRITDKPLGMIRLFYWLTPGVVPTSIFICCNCGEWIYIETNKEFHYIGDE